MIVRTVIRMIFPKGSLCERIAMIIFHPGNPLILKIVVQTALSEPRFA